VANKIDKIKASTQQHLDVDDITENLVLLKNGSVAMILSTTAVNFDILSEAEQDATIYAYAAFLNSLSFPLQVIIRSKKADITSYFKHLEESMRNQPNPDLKKQIQKYMEFIKSTVQKKTILDKHFYFVINYAPFKVGFQGIGKPKQTNQKRSKAQIIKDAKVNLFPRRDHLIKQSSRLGLITEQLVSKDLIELFYDIYNPAPTGTQRIILDTASYTAPLVQPAVENPNPAPDNTQQYSQPPTNATAKSVSTPQAAPNSPPMQKQALGDLQNASSNAADFIQQRKAQLGQTPPTPPTKSPVSNQPVPAQPNSNHLVEK